MNDYDYRFETKRVVFVIDTKSFYASVEAVARGLHPMKVPLVVVSKGPNVGGGGLVLATSPMAKKRYGLKHNVSRLKDLQGLPDLIQVPPRMNHYIDINLAINKIYRQYVADQDWHPYSIDESLLDMTDTWEFFGPTPQAVARKIQLDVHAQTGLYTTVGIGDNPTLAKIALDLYAKHDSSFIGDLHFETVPEKLWPINQLDRIWSIGHRTAHKLNQMGIYSMADLAHANPFRLRKVFGPQNGLRLYALAWGVDRTLIREKVVPASQSLGNSQILPRDYHKQREIELVIKEMAENLAIRLRKGGKLASNLSLYAGAASTSEYSSVKVSRNIEATQNTKELQDLAISLFREKYQGGAIRQIGISGNQLSDSSVKQLSLFESVEENQTNKKQELLQKVIDEIRETFDFLSIQKASSLSEGSRVIYRNKLIGGHAASQEREEKDVS